MLFFYMIEKEEMRTTIIHYVNIKIGKTDETDARDSG